MNQAVEEGSPILFRGYPPQYKHNIHENTEFRWLMNGANVNETAQFLKIGGDLIIPLVSRMMNGTNVTYRSIESSGRVTEVNTTLRISCK